MSEESKGATAVSESTTEYDAVVIGAGFAGLRMLHEMRELGLTVRVIEAGTDVGGTWHWNRYPGARSDTEAWAYCYWFDQGLQDDWNWTERFPRQPEIEGYLKHVADRFDMRRDIEFGTRVLSAHWDDDTTRWTVRTDGGAVISCTYVVCGTGLLSITNDPPFPGLDTFEGEWHQSSRWPEQKVDFTGKRVAVVGTGATGVQLIPVIANTAGELTVFQRTPNYVMPGRNRILDDEDRQWIRANYPAIWEQARNHVFAFPMDPANRVIGDVASPEEHQQVLEAGWEAGGFRYVFETFDDLLVDQTSNDVAAEFVRRKIRAIVKDPETAETLCPTTHPVGGKRPPLGHFYYETYNRENVSLVSVRDNPITEITPKGIKLQDGTEHEVDIIVFALGFDAVTGAMTTMDIRGRDGRTIADEWARWPNNYIGITSAGFPNLFSLLGPGGPFANAPVTIEKQGEWIGKAITHAREAGTDYVEPTEEAVERWVGHCEDVIGATLLKDGAAAGGAWYVGANIPGKKAQGGLYYWGGCKAYYAELAAEIDRDFENFRTSPGVPQSAAS